MRRLLLSLLLAALLLAGLAFWGGVGVAEFARTLAELPLRVYFAALGVHLAIYALRALRFRQLLPPASRPPFLRMLAISSAHNLAAYVLPAKTGEATLVVYLKTICGVPASEGLASLLVSRLLDLATLAGGVACACLALTFGPRAAEREWLGALGGVLLALALVLGVLCLRPDVLLRFGIGVSRAAGLERTRLGARVHARAEAFSSALRHAGADGRLARGAATSVALWIGVFLFYALLVRGLGMGADVSFAEATIGSGLSTVANLLPINGFAGFGTQEAGWVVGFGALGVPRELALSTGVAAHIVQLFNVVLLGLLGHLAMGVGSARVREV